MDYKSIKNLCSLSTTFCLKSSARWSPDLLNKHSYIYQGSWAELILQETHLSNCQQIIQVVMGEKKKRLPGARVTAQWAVCNSSISYWRVSLNPASCECSREGSRWPSCWGPSHPCGRPRSSRHLAEARPDPNCCGHLRGKPNERRLFL